MDKSWISKSRLSEEYENGVDMFLDFAFNNLSYEDKIICPCVRCGLIFPVTRTTCYDHLMADGFMESYTSWILHGENPSSITTEIPNSTNNEPIMHMDTNELLHDAFGVPLDNIGGDLHDREKSGEEPNESAKKFYDLLNDGQKELFPGSKNSTKLSFILEIFHIKCLGGWSNKSFTMLLELLHKTFPGILLPKTFYEVDKLIKSLVLGYEKIDACPNDCLLYRKEFKDDLECNVCHESRYLKNDGNDGDSSNGVSSSITTKIPDKVLHYFPLIPRLQRLFMSSKTASSMRWHKEGRTKDGCMRHPADSPAWKTFDHVNSDFSADCRNVRLGLASDGMNPFKTMSTTHSTWPVVLVHYNMEPSECLKQTNLIVSMIIPGPNSPGNNIDVYLQPLIDELQELWSNGVETYDASMKHNFKMRAALLWTISDFPGYAILSGWSTKGKYACPYCHEHTCHHWLTKGRKHCYLGSRRFLDEDHPFRDDHKSFDGTKERRLAPEPLSGTSILDCLSGFDLRYGKTVSNPDLPFNWKKRSIFFQLPYWKNNLVHHNLDLMHNEKNICESAIGTLLGIPGKTKDNLNARLDMKLLEIRPELHPTEEGADKDSFPPACFSLNKEGKTAFCRFLKNVKVPDGYAANISRCVDIKHRRIFGLKSHDYHVLMQQLLPLSIRGLLPAHVTSTLTELSKFFRDLSSKVGTPEEFRRLERRIPIILCELEKIFPPSFFDIMVHLMLHLPTEARLAGPVSFRSMWFVERYLATLKGFVRNRNHPEGSIAKNYLVNECMTFCSRYM